jgi:hypothetical protein
MLMHRRISSGRTAGKALPFGVTQVVPDQDGDAGRPHVDQNAVYLGVVTLGDDPAKSVDEGRIADRVVGVVGRAASGGRVRQSSQV